MVRLLPVQEAGEQIYSACQLALLRQAEFWSALSSILACCMTPLPGAKHRGNGASMSGPLAPTSLLITVFTLSSHLGYQLSC